MFVDRDPAPAEIPVGGRQKARPAVVAEGGRRGRVRPRQRGPEGVTVKDVNMVMELEALSFALSREEGEE